MTNVHRVFLFDEQHTTESRYIAAQYNMVLHSAQQLRRWNFGQASNSRKTPIPRPHGRAMGVFRELFGENDRKIPRELYPIPHMGSVVSI